MENTKQQLVDRIKSASNVLVTVSRNPSVDALSALLGLTLILNKQGKHAAAVFSGVVPSTLEFLQPEETIEKNTDSLRDFIIALDKNKADKLRYKVEDNVVRIFITPYRTSISQEDFEFSEGDFNVDVVIAVGVRQQEELDEAITVHGRILHDATVASINILPDAGLGSINWSEPQASSLSELVTELGQLLGPNLLDEQIATALLTGIVAETNRFSNDKTSSVTMSMSASLMKAGANQQLVASKLEEQHPFNNDSGDFKRDSDGDNTSGSVSTKPNDGTIEIDHSDETEKDKKAENSKADEGSQTLTDKPEDTPIVSDTPQEAKTVDDTTVPDIEKLTEPTVVKPAITGGSRLITEPPTLGGTLTANMYQSDADPVTNPLSEAGKDMDNTVLQHPEPVNVKAPDLAPLLPPSLVPPAPAINTQPPQIMTPPPPTWSPPPVVTPSPQPSPTVTPTPTPPPAAPVNTSPPELEEDKTESETLSQIEEAVSSSHVPSTTVDAARAEVNRAYSDTPQPLTDALPPIDALNATQLGGDLHPEDNSKDDTAANPTDSSAPPPVPPPIPFQFGSPPSS